jgi:hypothetical protein
MQPPSQAARSAPRRGVTGSLAEIIIPPYFRQAPALLDCETTTLRWPGSFDAGFLSPQPPGVVRTGPVRSSYSQYWANESWSFLFCAIALGAVHERRPALLPTSWQARDPRSWLMISKRRVASPRAPRGKFSEGSCMPRRASGRACRGCHPGHTPRRRRHPRVKYSPAAPSNWWDFRSSHPP